MLVSPEEYELLVQFIEWFRGQGSDHLVLMHSEEIVAEFLDLD